MIPINKGHSALVLLLFSSLNLYSYFDLIKEGIIEVERKVKKKWCTLGKHLSEEVTTTIK